MKNLYNEIEQNLKAGLHVVVKDLKGIYYCAISPFKDEDKKYRYSGWCGLIGEAKKRIGAYGGYLKISWDDFDLEIVEVYRPEFEPFKIGQKVRILDSIKKTETWESVEDKFEDMTGEVKQVYYNMMGTYYAINCWYVGHEHLAPLVEVEDNVALEAIKLLEEKGYKIIKK